MMASVLTCFKITPHKDKDGNAREVNGDFEDNGLMKWVTYTHVLMDFFSNAILFEFEVIRVNLSVPFTFGPLQATNSLQNPEMVLVLATHDWKSTYLDHEVEAWQLKRRFKLVSI